MCQIVQRIRLRTLVAGQSEAERPASSQLVLRQKLVPVRRMRFLKRALFFGFLKLLACQPLRIQATCLT